MFVASDMGVFKNAVLVFFGLLFSQLSCITNNR